MLNKGTEGMMVFEPSFLHVAPGDTVRFIPVDKGHNAETIDKMLPEGAQPFAGKISKEISVTLTQPGLYGIRCKPHYGMGMVALISVGAPEHIGQAKTVKHPGKAKRVFAALLERLAVDQAAAQ